ncbi:DoxX family protein [Mangrovactinospora gilvigrisea]|uniref:DoxX family protein n=1 Tax=Mangrovactinospora gilvigrisea TaxID=1428644 RepID=UPI000D1B351A|nr:DoxX family membrane protein [Mangrovactinospora gilvigrisea]
MATTGVSFRVSLPGRGVSARRAAPPETPMETSLTGIPLIRGGAAAAVGRASASAIGHTGVVAGSGVARPPRRRVVMPDRHAAAASGDAAAALLASAVGAGAVGGRRAGAPGPALPNGLAGHGGSGGGDPEATQALPVVAAGARVLRRRPGGGGVTRPVPAPTPPPLQETAMMPPVRIAPPQDEARPAVPLSATEQTGAFRRLTGVHAWYPGRRMNLGLVLLPLRIVLGVMMIGAGVAKLTDPVYFDGGSRGSMMRWLLSLHPWQLAAPLVDFAIQHPIGSGLTVAFVQIAIGALSVLGLWQRVCAAAGMLLAAALLVTVSWRSAPVWDTPAALYLAAWSPLLIAGAPLFSIDSRLAAEAWRRFQPRPEVWQLRRRVIVRGTPMVALVLGLTLLLGAGLGASTRGQARTGTGPGLPAQEPLPSHSSSPMGPVVPGEPRLHSAAPSPTRSSSPSPTPSNSAVVPSGAPSRSPSGTTTGGAPAGSGQGTSSSHGYGREPSGTGTGGGATTSSHSSGTGGAQQPAPTHARPSSGGGGGDGSTLGGLLGG